MRVFGSGQLDDLVPAPVDLIRRTELPRLDHHCRRLVELSALVRVANADGTCDVWDPATFAPRATLPALGQMLADQTRPDAAELEPLVRSEQAERS